MNIKTSDQIIIPKSFLKFFKGDIKSAIFLSKIIELSSAKNKGWNFIPYKYWENEFSMSKNIAIRIIKKLKNKKYIVTKIKKINGRHDLFIKVNEKVFMDEFNNSIYKN